MFCGRRSRGSEGNHKLIGRVRTQIDDLDRLTRGEIIVSAADRTEVSPGGAKYEQVVIRGNSAGVERVVPLKDEGRWIASYRNVHYDRWRAGRIKVLKAPRVE